MSNVREGQFYYGPHRNMWGVWRKGADIDGIQMDDFIEDFPLKTQAREYVYIMNGWKQK